MSACAYSKKYENLLDILIFICYYYLQSFKFNILEGQTRSFDKLFIKSLIICTLLMFLKNLGKFTPMLSQNFKYPHQHSQIFANESHMLLFK
jgi:hypothetical protein